MPTKGAKSLTHIIIGVIAVFGWDNESGGVVIVPDRQRPRPRPYTVLPVRVVDMSSLVPSSAELDRWIEVAKECEYLPENDLKVGELLLGSSCFGIAETV